MSAPPPDTALEPPTAAMPADLPGASARLSRFRVVAIDLGAAPRGESDPAPVVAAAELLADARVASVCWNGTAGARPGLDLDRALCGAVAARTGVLATTATLALVEALRRLGAPRCGSVTPWLGEVQAAMVPRWAEVGLERAAERHLGDARGFSFPEHGEGAVRRMTPEVPSTKPVAVVIRRTDSHGGRAALELEAELNLPAPDSVAVALPGAARAAGGSAAPPSPR